MKCSNEGKVEIIGHEGLSLSKYKDSVGVWTIGAGSTKTEIPDLASWPLTKTITVQAAFDLFSSSLAKYEDAINNALTRPILQTQFDALVSWCYNVGIGWVPKSTIIRRLNTWESGQSLSDALLAYNKPPEILPRRRKEAWLLVTGKYSNDGKANLFPVSTKGYPMYSKGKEINVWQYIPHSATADPKVPIVQIDAEKKAEIRPSFWAPLISLIKDKIK